MVREKWVLSNKRVCLVGLKCSHIGVLVCLAFKDKRGGLWCCARALSRTLTHHVEREEREREPSVAQVWKSLTMRDQYETQEKAEKYDLFKKSNKYVSKVFRPTVFDILNYSLEGKRVIDLACGAASSTKMLADMKPDELVAVDLSAEMIHKAQKECFGNPNYSNIKFYVKDCLEPINLGLYDVVFASHLLDYAETKENLNKFYRVMFDSTKENGIAAGVMMSHFLSLEDIKESERYKKYGFTMRGERSQEDEKMIVFGMFYHNDQALFSVNVWIWPTEIHDQTARQVGFKRVEWIHPTLAESEHKADGFWDKFLELSPFIFYKLYK